MEHLESLSEIILTSQTFPTAERNSSKCLGGILPASCTQKTVLASLSLGVRLSIGSLTGLGSLLNGLLLQNGFCRDFCGGLRIFYLDFLSSFVSFASTSFPLLAFALFPFSVSTSFPLFCFFLSQDYDFCSCCPPHPPFVTFFMAVSTCSHPYD